ncbi:MAG: FAD-dependent oxidoreductase [Rhodothermales bacterium]
MVNPGTTEFPLRIAIIGSGPAGFYAADHLFKQKDVSIEIDMFDRLPTPFGLVRGGVAPDHQKIKNVTRVFDRIARRDEFRFYGNVEIGRDLSVDDLLRHYHGVVFATGAQTDRSLGIPGENLAGSHSATEFVAWYNGHPDFRHLEFDLSRENVVIIGVGNVAVDVARILCRTVDELVTTDIADYALEALRESKVRNVYMLGRRGPAQAAFTNPEARELGELPGADIVFDAAELELDEVTQKLLGPEPDRDTRTKLEILDELAHRESKGAPRRLFLRFLVSPVELIGDEEGHVHEVRIVHNRLVERNGRSRPVPTDEFETLPAGLVFRSVGYRGVPVPGMPFDKQSGTIPNRLGRVVDPETREIVPGLYVAGWIKRGPSGVIGTNKPDSVETAEQVLEDLREGHVHTPEAPSRESIRQVIAVRRPDHFTYEDWLCVDDHETALGATCGRPRVKLTSVEEMLSALRQAAPEKD